MGWLGNPGPGSPDDHDGGSGHGIGCLGLVRVSSLAQWGYLAGYVTYPEALALVEPAAQKVCETYGSWDEAQGAYLAGYCKWAGLSAAVFGPRPGASSTAR